MPNYHFCDIVAEDNSNPPPPKKKIDADYTSDSPPSKKKKRKSKGIKIFIDVCSYSWTCNLSYTDIVNLTSDHDDLLNNPEVCEVSDTLLKHLQGSEPLVADKQGYVSNSFTLHLNYFFSELSIYCQVNVTSNFILMNCFKI